jgi:NAD(P)-dependent dehydrogenase (short-subunit alcohol dehydrogenase family)
MLERLRLDGKTAIVTGAGRGLGRQMSLALAQAGADVVCAARSLDQIEHTADDIRALGRRAVAHTTDVRESAACDALVRRAVDEFGRLDIMLSNAGIGDMRSAGRELWDIEDDAWRDTLEVNLSSAFYCARAASKVMVDQGQGGAIINVASGTATRAYTLDIGYGSAKAGVIAMTKTLSAMLVKHNIRVNCIIPGYVQQSPAQDDRSLIFAQTRGKYLPVQRLGEAWELGPLAIFLASDASSYVHRAGLCDRRGRVGGRAGADDVRASGAVVVGNASVRELHRSRRATSRAESGTAGTELKLRPYDPDSDSRTQTSSRSVS